jgi:PAS domain-containing protein
MSSTLHDRADGSHDVGLCDDAFARGMIASGVTCALVDQAGVVIDASASLRALVPNLVGSNVRETLQIEPSVLRSPGIADGIYNDAEGARVPAVVQLLYDIENASTALLVVTDGARFRRAETSRFDSTPYTVMRVSPDGIIRYANPAALKVLQAGQGGIVGCGLASMFRASDAALISERLAQCLKKESAQPLKVAIGASGGLPDNVLKLITIPDLTPDQRVLGAIVVIESSAQEHIREEISKVALNPAIKDWRERLDLILGKVSSLINFDHAIYGIYAENVSLFRAVSLHPKGSIGWPARWMALSPKILEWLDTGRTWVDDIEKFIGADMTLRESEVGRCYLNAGIRSSVTLVVRGAEGPTSAFSLCSKKLAAYGEDDLKILRELDLEPVLLRCEEQIAAERMTFADEMNKLVEDTPCLQTAAVKVVDRIVEHFEWDYAGLFRVDRNRQLFQLFHQIASEPEYRIKEDTAYVQSLDKGMLAETLRDNCIYTVDEIGVDDIEQHGYLGLGRELHSAMTVPVHLNGRVRWVLDLASSVSHTFLGPDRASLKHVVSLVEAALSQRMLAEMKVCLLHETEQGAVVVGMEGGILEMNSIAAGLLGRQDERVGGKTIFLSEYAADDHAKDVLEGALKTVKRSISLKGEDGKLRHVFATRRDLDISFDAALWFFTDPESVQWNRDLRFMRETVADVAQQTRAPLSLASSLARQIPKLWSTAENGSTRAAAKNLAEEICKRLLAEIGKADITFERLAESRSIRNEPIREWERVDLGRCVKEVIALLPERDKEHIRSSFATGRISVTGDEGRLTFVVRSIVAHLLRTRPADQTRVEVTLRSESYDVSGSREAVLTVRLTVPETVAFPDSPESGQRDEIWLACQAARDDASLSLDLIKSVIEAHKGNLITQPLAERARDLSLPWISFQISIPQT